MINLAEKITGEVKGETIIEARNIIEEEIKSFFIQGDYNEEVILPTGWTTQDLGIVLREVNEILYQGDWMIETKIVSVNVDGSINIKIEDMSEES